MQPPLKPGELPNITDTDPPPMHEATVVHEAYVGVDESKCSKEELAEVRTRHRATNIYTPEHEPETKDHERHGTRTTTVTVSRTTTH